MPGMIYRIHVAVLLAVPENWGNLPETEKTFWDAVAYTFGLKASDASDAVNLTVTAAQNAVGRDGEFIGGVVVETHCRCVNREEFDGYEKYFLRQMNERGIFYVSGVTSYAISKEQATEAAAELEKVKEKIIRCGLPTPSFVHPKLPEEPPKKVRLVCSVCGRWVEVDNLRFICSFMEGLDMFSREQREAWKSQDVAGPFLHRHLSQCFLGYEPSPRGIVGIQEDDERWRTLSVADREDVDGSVPHKRISD
jgi:hypothetical protein